MDEYMREAVRGYRVRMGLTPGGGVDVHLRSHGGGESLAVISRSYHRREAMRALQRMRRFGQYRWVRR